MKPKYCAVYKREIYKKNTMLWCIKINNNHIYKLKQIKQNSIHVIFTFQVVFNFKSVALASWHIFWKSNNFKNRDTQVPQRISFGKKR